MPQSFKDAFQQAKAYAQAGRFSEMLSGCQRIVSSHSDDVTVLLDVGALLLSFGLLSHARDCFERAHRLAPNDLRAVANLANVERDAGNHTEPSRIYADLLQQAPNHPVFRRNALTSLEYDPAVSDAERLAQAQAWGEWAIQRAGGPLRRPPLRAPDGKPLRIGYVSADFCQHTVGLFVKNVLATHHPERLAVYAYSAGQVHDWVTNTIRTSCVFRDVSSLDDARLAELIRQDGIDILVDLSGHTAGSRLTVFAHRPAPVQISWLGYFATTGLPYLDAVLMDAWHVPDGFEAQFVEPVRHLATGRFCYQAVPWAPAEVAPPPCLSNGYVTFGCFNNTAKFNDQVLNLWAQILTAVPNSRLVLKWRTFNDEAFSQSVTNAFAQRGVAPQRIELRGPSFHADLLKEYADIDIALDPFPFTGGLTSCEALWMGVPVVTWPQSRPVSRQTFAFLAAMDLAELAAGNSDEYLHIAVALAADHGRLTTLRDGMRARMQASPLMNLAGFMCQFEQCLMALYADIYADTKDASMTTPKTLLNVGAGHPQSGARIPAIFQTPAWKEVRLDVDPVNQPDVLGTMLDMSAVADTSVDALYSAHTIEHLYPDEVPVALKEFLRVLKPDGFIVITCPDLQAAAQMIAEDRLLDVAYTSKAGSVTPFDIVYSHRQFTGRDKPYMAHHCGFTLKVLLATLQANGFPSAAGKRRPAAFDLWVVAFKKPLADDITRELAAHYLPA